MSWVAVRQNLQVRVVVPTGIISATSAVASAPACTKLAQIGEALAKCAREERRVGIHADPPRIETDVLALGEGLVLSWTLAGEFSADVQDWMRVRNSLLLTLRKYQGVRCELSIDGNRVSAVPPPTGPTSGGNDTGDLGDPPPVAEPITLISPVPDPNEPPSGDEGGALIATGPDTLILQPPSTPRPKTCSMVIAESQDVGVTICRGRQLPTFISGDCEPEPPVGANLQALGYKTGACRWIQIVLAKGIRRTVTGMA